MSYFTDLALLAEDHTDIHECSRSWEGPCQGPLEVYTSHSGITRSWMCEGHIWALEDRLAEIAQRYPEVNHPEGCGCWGCSEGSY